MNETLLPTPLTWQPQESGTVLGSASPDSIEIFESPCPAPSEAEQMVEQAPFNLMLLPEEIIENICWCLTGPYTWTNYPGDRTNPLANLCLTSKTLNRIATPVLYSDFDSQNELKRIACFLNTICDRPELGEHIQSVSCHLIWGTWHSLSRSWKEKFEATAARLGGSLDGEWDEETPFQTMTQLILAHTPNLRTFDFQTDEVYVGNRVGAFTLLKQLSAQSSSRVSLPHLRQFSYSHDKIRDMSLDYFAGLFAVAPNIRTLYADPTYDAFRGEDNPERQLQISNVSELFIHSGIVSSAGLRVIVSSCNRLEKFQFHHHTMYSGMEYPSTTPRQIIEALEVHKDSLRSIDIDLSGRERSESDARESEPRDWPSYHVLCYDGDQILSLQEFSVLEIFKVDGSSILFPKLGSANYRTDILVKMLPRSLRCFHLVYTQSEAAANMMAVADSIAEFPYMGEIRLVPNPANGPLEEQQAIFDQADVDRLQKVFDNRRIKFETIAE
ncbi:hypothetical protein GQ53DRAFT_675318 [Thozetella sp. PMI_491]|nr:hypothetical protein GQ53DRAFT_675318 [Thozetella sp. PMI_491]